jgi:hypothetical protein
MGPAAKTPRREMSTYAVTGRGQLHGETDPGVETVTWGARHGEIGGPRESNRLRGCVAHRHELVADQSHRSAVRPSSSSSVSAHDQIVAPGLVCSSASATARP